MGWGSGIITNFQRGLEPSEDAGSGDWWEDSPELAAEEDRRLGVTVLKRETLQDKIIAAMNTTAPGVWEQVVTDFKRSLSYPKTRLEHSHWSSDEDRLLYLRYYFEYLYRWDGAEVDRDALFGSMLQYEMEHGDITVGRIPTAKEKRELHALRARKRKELDEREAAAELREYLKIVEEIRRQEQFEAQTRPMRVDLRAYPIYTHGAGAVGAPLAAAYLLIAPYLNFILNFVPIIGQMKMLAEAIVGYDMTGRKLTKWERGLGLLLGLLPGAVAVFRAGAKGLRALAKAGVEAIRRGRTAEEVYRLAKVASKMTEAEIEAAKLTATAGKVKASASQIRAAENLADQFAEMEGMSQRNWRAAAGTIDNGVGTSRSAAGVIDTATKVPGKMIAATEAAAPIVSKLTKAGVLPEAIAKLERAGIVFSRRLVGILAKETDAIDFVNKFHDCPGFTELVKDLGVSAGKREGALFAMSFALNRIEPAKAFFELGAGITKRVRGTEVAARLVDITAGGVSYELKSWSKWTLERALRVPRQLIKDTAIFGRSATKWVFNSAKGMSKSQIVELFKDAITKDPYLSAKWPSGQALDDALGELIVLFP